MWLNLAKLSINLAPVNILQPGTVRGWCYKGNTGPRRKYRSSTAVNSPKTGSVEFHMDAF